MEVTNRHRADYKLRLLDDDADWTAQPSFRGGQRWHSPSGHSSPAAGTGRMGTALVCSAMHGWCTGSIAFGSMSASLTCSSLVSSSTLIPAIWSHGRQQSRPDLWNRSLRCAEPESIGRRGAVQNAHEDVRIQPL